MWIDALCINQADNEEKGIQVSIMGKIFATAERVISWLGPEEDNSNQAMALLLSVGRKLDLNRSEGTLRPFTAEVTGKMRFLFRRGGKRRRLQSIEILDPEVDIPWTTQKYKAILFLLARPYFRRAWIVQEIQLAKRVVFQCGFVTLNEDDLWKAVICLNPKQLPKGTKIARGDWIASLQEPSNLAHMRAWHNLISVYTLRHDLGHFFCQDPRDKIYSVLGILSPSSCSLQIKPNYDRETRDLYIDFAQRIFTTRSCIDTLNACELWSRTLDIPSWVPDWSTPVNCTHLLPSRWSACAWIASRPTFDGTGLRCTVPGIFITRITELKEALLSRGEITREEFFRYMRAIRPSGEDMTSLYMTGQTLMEVYCRVLIADGFRDAYQPSNPLCPNFAQGLDSLTLAWSDHASDIERVNASERPNTYFQAILNYTSKRRFFRSSDGYLGLAPLETQTGDALCVLLGCRFPIILRPAANHTWLVVGPCYAHGLMRGETIYRNKLVAESLSSQSGRDDCLEFFDPEDGLPYFSAEEMLERSGIKVESRQDDPLALFVLPETLQTAGIQVEDFVLV